MACSEHVFVHSGLPDHVFKCAFHVKDLGFISSRSTPQTKKKAQEGGTDGRLALEVGSWPKLRCWCGCTGVQVWAFLTVMVPSEQCVPKSHLLTTSLQPCSNEPLPCLLAGVYIPFSWSPAGISLSHCREVGKAIWKHLPGLAVKES